MSPVGLTARALFAALLCGGAACAPCGPSEGVVSEVVDGDTIRLESGETIRYLLVDTPESTRADNIECYGPEAKEFNRSLVLGQRVTLQYDQECHDKYDRTLAFVSVEGRSVSALLVERGFGCVLHIPPNGDAQVDDYEALEAAARQAGRGLWGACSPRPCG